MELVAHPRAPSEAWADAGDAETSSVCFAHGRSSSTCRQARTVFLARTWTEYGFPGPTSRTPSGSCRGTPPHRPCDTPHRTSLEALSRGAEKRESCRPISDECTRAWLSLPSYPPPSLGKGITTADMELLDCVDVVDWC